MADPDRDEFYVGYFDRAPQGIASRVRGAVVLMILITAVVALAVVQSQRSFAKSRFEFGNVREFRGLVVERPHPVLLVPRPGDVEGASRYSQFRLTGKTKFGADADVSGFDGKPVKLAGSLIYRDGRTMIKLESGSVESIDLDPSLVGELPATVDLGEHTLTGEIVDSMCWLGLMKPGASKPHRACAVRCISGGAPPVLLVRHATGEPGYYLLVSRDNRPLNREILDLVAEPVEVTGRVVRDGDLLMLRADRNEIRRR